jgi:hypothetical protein
VQPRRTLFDPPLSRLTKALYASYETTTILRPAYYSYRDEYMPLNPGGRQPLLAHTKQTEYCLGPLPFSEPARLTINAVGVGFRQLTQIAASALFSFAEKVLGIFLTPQYGCATVRRMHIVLRDLSIAWLRNEKWYSDISRAPTGRWIHSNCLQS